MLEARFIEEPVIDEEMALIDRAACCREGRTGDDTCRAKRIAKSFAYRTDIAVGRRIEGRAIFEDDLLATLAHQPVQRLERKRHGLCCWNGARFERDDGCFAIGLRRFRRDPEILRHRHSLSAC
jgi:hypothetical protein